MIVYHAENLEDVAALFIENAAREDGNGERAATVRNAVVSRARAAVWRSAAEILRSTVIEPKVTP